MPQRESNGSNMWFRGAMVLVIPVVALAILGGTAGQEGLLHDIYMWLTLGLLILMAICLIMGRISRGEESTSGKPEESGVL